MSIEGVGNTEEIVSLESAHQSLWDFKRLALGSRTLQQYLTLSKLLHLFKCHLVLQNGSADTLGYLELVIMKQYNGPSSTREYFQLTNEQQTHSKILNLSCLKYSTYILPDSIVELCEAGFSTFIIEIKKLKMGKVPCQMLGSTWETALIALFLIVLYQVPLKIIVSATFRLRLESDHIPSPPGGSHRLLPSLPCGPPNHICYLLQGWGFWNLKVFQHSQEAKVQAMVSKAICVQILFCL